LTGTWGDTVNNSITSLLDTAIAGTTTLSTDADVTLTTTTLASNQARQAIILWTAGGTVTRTITAPASSKTYIVINKTSSTQSIKLVGAGPTTGITIVAGESVQAAWNGVDFIRIASTSAVSSFSAGTTGFTPSTATTGAITLSGTLGVTNGGTGLSTLTAGYIPYGNGTSPYSNSVNFSYNGSTLRVGNQALLGGATNPIVGATGSANSFIQSYIYNASNSVNSSADFVAYPNNGSDSSGFVDVGITSQTYADALYSVTGPNESYVFASGASGAGNTGNLVYATDSTGTANSHQWYVGGFNQAKGSWKMQLSSTAMTVTPVLTLGSSYTEAPFSANSSTAITINLANGTLQIITLTGSATITMPAAVSGKSFTMLLKTGAGGYAVIWSTVNWPNGTAPTITSTASKMDKLVFTSDGTNWYGSVAGQAYTA
jgi:hypothetical protein